MSWLQRILPAIGKSENFKESSANQVPGGLWEACPSCQKMHYTPDLDAGLRVCLAPECGHHLRVSARQRLEFTLDTGAPIKEFGEDIKTTDRLKFRDTKKYKDRLQAAQKATSEPEALVTVTGKLKGMTVVVASFEFAFLGGSMGAAVGEKFVAAVDKAIEKGLPLICFATSGGARMQESMFSLLQMARTSAAIERMKQKGYPYISVLVDPVYGGVAASLAMLGDINIAEPDALIGFTGQRVIEQTVRVKLPPTFQRSEFLLKHGAIDMIVSRKDMRDKLASLIKRLMDARNAQS